MKISKKNTKNLIDQASILSKALPFMQRYSGKNITIKFGGAVMGDLNLSTSFAKDIVLLKQVGINPVVVHGGGPKIKKMLDKLNVKSNFIDGLRVTDKETMNIVEMVLSGSINKEIVMEINKEGGSAIGLSGKDALLAETKKIKINKNVDKSSDLGFVGEPKKINDQNNLLKEKWTEKMEEHKFQTLCELWQMAKQFKYIDSNTKIIFVRNRIPKTLIKSQIKVKASLVSLGGGYYASGTNNLKRYLDSLPKTLYYNDYRPSNYDWSDRVIMKL